MASLDDMVSQLPMDQIARALGVDEATAAAATKTAVPALVQGMRANATADPAKAAALATAIASHAHRAAAGAGTATGPDVSRIDTVDGEKIVGHVFGDNTEQVTNQLGGLPGGAGGADLFKRLLPMLAPLVMGFLAKNLGGGGGGGGASSGGGGGGGLGGLLSKITSMFGGGKTSTTGTTTASGSGDIGDLLGGLLGGTGGDIGDALGGLLGRGSGTSK